MPRKSRNIRLSGLSPFPALYHGRIGFQPHPGAWPRGSIFSFIFLLRILLFLHPRAEGFSLARYMYQPLNVAVAHHIRSDWCSYDIAVDFAHRFSGILNH